MTAEERHDTSPLPASDTKHLGALTYRLPRLGCSLALTQVAGDGSTTGSTLWLSSQILACYLQSKYDRRVRSTTATAAPRAIDLGAGVGLTSLVLQRLGWHVAATDVAPPLHTVLQPNVTRNSAGDSVRVTELDWLSFDGAAAYAEEEVYDLIVTADTVYEQRLVDGLLAVIASLLARRRGDADTVKSRPRCHALIALERRDPQLVEYALSRARDAHGLVLQRIPQREVRRAVDDYMTAGGSGKRGADASWPREAWDDVEIWRAELSKAVG